MLLRFCLRMPLHVSRDANVGNRPRAPYQTKSLWSLPKLLHRHRLRGFYSYCTKKKRCALPPSSKLSFCPCNLCLSSCNGFYYIPFSLTYVDVLVVDGRHQTSGVYCKQCVTYPLPFREFVLYLRPILCLS